MSKLTVLDIVKKMLNDTDGDSVNSVADTPEALQMLEIVEDEYHALIADRPFKHEQGFFILESLGDSSRPNYLRIPDDIEEIGELKYDKIKASETRSRYLPVIYCDPVYFNDMLDSRDHTKSNVIVVTDFDGTKLNIRNDVAPTYWTSFDDEHIIFDSFDSGVESTVQGDKAKTFGFKNGRTPFQKTDNFVPDIPEDQFPLLLAECKKRASQVSRQIEDPGANEKSVKLNRWSARKNWRARGGIKTSNYGRASRASLAPVRRRNPQFDKN